MNRYKKMSVEELQKLSIEKKKNGCYKKTAIAAQIELYKRNHYPGKELELDNGYIDRTIEEIDYEGL